ncbi:hypothetical protein [Hamadaea tsunoensis]|uniref:hypothetical protein n=1 Tax=Hamadaea tsunoensis TaxID=53368 RepID=UPI00040D3725|nr:hypothetical protein [Hamadaea tsunoensis]
MPGLPTSARHIRRRSAQSPSWTTSALGDETVLDRLEELRRYAADARIGRVD